MSNVEESVNESPTLEAQVAKVPNSGSSEYITLPNGHIITTQSIPGAGNGTTSEHMRSLLKGYNPHQYGYHGPIPINKRFRCWDRMWEVK